MKFLAFFLASGVPTNIYSVEKSTNAKHFVSKTHFNSRPIFLKVKPAVIQEVVLFIVGVKSFVMSCQELLQFALCVSWREDKGKMHFIFRQFCKVALHHMLVKQIASSGLYFFFPKMPTDLIWQCNALIKYGGFYQIELCTYILNFSYLLSTFLLYAEILIV